MTLTQKQLRFVAEYQLDRNATQAAIRAGYSPKTAGAIGSENLQKPEIAAALEARTVAALEAVDASVERITRELARVAFGDIRSLVSWDGASVVIRDSDELTEDEAALVREVKVQRNTTRGKDGSEHESETREVKVWDKLSALALLAKRHPEFRDSTNINVDARTLNLPSGATLADLRALAQDAS